MKAIQAGLLYVAIVFAAGFVLGVVRTLWIVPLIGSRWAELLEMPMMLGVILLAARSLITRLTVPPTRVSRLGMGVLALLLLLTVEFALVLPLRGLTIAQYIATRDPVSGIAYYGMLLVFALLPLWIAPSPLPSSRSPEVSE